MRLAIDLRSTSSRIRTAFLCALVGAATTGTAAAPVYGPADPVARDPERFDARRPMAREMQTDVPDGYSVAAVGDLIISRPVSQHAASVPAFRAVLEVLRAADVATGNMETTVFAARTFTGAPYAWDGDWTNAGVPEVAKDLRAMGFGIVGRANNHALDWGLDGLFETGRWLDEAGISHAGAGRTEGEARAPGYLETSRARVAMVSIASTFRPTTEALPPRDSTPGRPGLSALHVHETIRVPADAMRSLAATDCSLNNRHCADTPTDLELFDRSFRLGPAFAYEYAMDPDDLAAILKSIRAARQNADIVIVAIHSHECSSDCDHPDQPRGPGDFLTVLAHAAIDSGADIFFATGNHNLGPVELYRSPVRGTRPIFYGLGNFFWSDVQELLPDDLFRLNRALLGQAWRDPAKATAYDLTAPLNRAAFANDFTFHSVIAVSRFAHNELAEIRLYPIELGYGERLPKSGLPRLATDPALSGRIADEVRDATRHFGLPELAMRRSGNFISIAPKPDGADERR